MAARAIMIQGTASHVGKSVLVAALCRIFYRDGYYVAPFKSQNMALNSYITRDGGEMGRAQVVQAEAAGIEPAVEMNPILLKPTGQASSQVIVLGKAVGNMSAQEYHLHFGRQAWNIVTEAYQRLSQEYEIVVIEGAGSPAEVNLQATEIVNMRVARYTGAPVLLVADIDKGGALASIVGTLELLPPEDRQRVAGIIINKFRGDLRLFQPAIDFLEDKTGVPVVGVVPYFDGFRIQEEDTVPEDVLEHSRRTAAEDKRDLEIAVVYLPHISNFTDFDPLTAEPDVHVRYVGRGTPVGKPDLLIIPGSKNTIEDLVFLKRSGLAEEVINLARQGVPVIGICGGYQMLGRKIYDPLQVESSLPEIEGLGLLPVTTTFAANKVTARVRALVCGTGPLLTELQGEEIEGYEIHMGRSEVEGPGSAPFKVREKLGQEVAYSDGAISGDGLVFGTYIHGLFDSGGFRRGFLNILRRRKGLAPLSATAALSAWEQRQRDFDRLAEVVRGSLRMDYIYRLLGLPGPRRAGVEENTSLS